MGRGSHSKVRAGTSIASNWADNLLFFQYFDCNTLVAIPKLLTYASEIHFGKQRSSAKVERRTVCLSCILIFNRSASADLPKFTLASKRTSAEVERPELRQPLPTMPFIHFVAIVNTAQVVSKTRSEACLLLRLCPDIATTPHQLRASYRLRHSIGPNLQNRSQGVRRFIYNPPTSTRV
jgi:hypothetical protein